MAITKNEKELAAIGISIAAGCKPCTDYHMKAVRQAGASDGEIRQAVQDAVALRNATTAVMEKYGLSYLGDTSIEHVIPPRDRLAEIVGLGTALAVNCVSSLKAYIRFAEAAGVTKEEIFEITELAKFIKGKGASHVDHQITALKQEIAAKSAA